MRKSTLMAFICLFLALGGLSSALWAQQSTTGTVEGTVSDPSGAVLPGVTLTLRNAATGFQRVTYTAGNGNFLAPAMPVGTYQVKAELDGFGPAEKRVEVNIGSIVKLDFTLGVAAATETIEVSAAAPVIETTRSSQSSTVDEAAVANLPTNGRNFIDFVLTTPGVTRDVRLGDISFAGQRGTLNSLVVDGADNNNTFFGQALGRTGSGRAPYQFSQDAVQEFQVNRNAYSAEYGRAGGAVINVVTKSGTNDFHGSLFEFYRDKSLNSNSFANELANRPKSEYAYDQFGGSLGGPLLRDRAFFFVNYDGQRNTIPNEVNLDANLAGLTLPSDPDTVAGLARLRALANTYDRGQDQDVLLVKTDFAINDNHRFSLRYNRQEFTGTNFENGGATNGEQHTGDSLVNTDSVNLSLSSTFGSRAFNELRGQWAKDQEPGKANSDLPEATIREQGRTILVVGRNFFSPRETTIDRLQLADTLTWLVANHTVKAGFDYNQDDILNFFPGNFSGAYTFNSIASWNRGRPNGSGERYVQAFAGNGTTGPTTEPNIDELAFFLQTDWKLRENLTLMLGLRYDVQDFAQPQVRNPSPELAAAGIDTSYLNKDDDNYALRAGLAYSLNDRTVLRAGYGLFYGRTPSIMVGTAHSNNGINVQTATFTGSATPTYPNLLPALPTGAALPKPTIFFFDKDYENPEVQQASLGAEFAVTPDLAVGVSGLYVKGENLQRSRDFNLGTPVPTAIPIQGGGTLLVNRYPTARPFTSFDRLIRFESTASSEYSGLTLEVRKRFSNELQANLAYTYGKVKDDAPDATAVVPSSGDDAKFAPDPTDFDAAWAPGNNDQRHRLVLSGLWNHDFGEGAFASGWGLAWIFTYQTGQPYSLGVTNDLNNDGNTRNDIVPGSRNSVYLPDSLTLDLRLTKRFPLGDKLKLELIAEAFNLLDRDNINSQRTVFYNYNVAGNVLIPVAGFGDDVAAADNRIGQLAVKLIF